MTKTLFSKIFALALATVSAVTMLPACSDECEQQSQHCFEWLEGACPDLDVAEQKLRQENPDVDYISIDGLYSEGERDCCYWVMTRESGDACAFHRPTGT